MTTVLLIGSLGGCRTSLSRERTVDVDRIAADPFFDLEPENGVVIEPFGPIDDRPTVGVTYSDQGLRVNRRWTGVDYDAMLTFLTEAAELGVVMSRATCLEPSAVDDDPALYQLQGAKLAGGYSASVSVRLRGDELLVSLGSLLDASPVEEPPSTAEAPDVVSLVTDTCSDEQLADITDALR